MAGGKEGPGPGNYNPLEKNLSTAPAYSMGYKNAKNGDGSWTPGPG